MKTVRFVKVVEKCGKPEVYLALMAPAKDRTLRAAVKTQRVMTVAQETVGTKTDRGEVGFHPGPCRQFLVFPKSLAAFAGRTVVGIKYDLLDTPAVPQTKRAAPSRPPKKARSKPFATARHEKREPPSKGKVVPFQPVREEDDEDEDTAAFKKQVRHAMAVLEAGNTVAAFNLLKRIVSD